MDRAIFICAMALFLRYNEVRLLSNEKSKAAPITLEVALEVDATSASKLRLTCKIEEHADNRWYTLAAVSEKDYHLRYGNFVEEQARNIASRCSKDAVEQVFTVKTGEYVITACVYRIHDGKPLAPLCVGTTQEVR